MTDPSELASIGDESMAHVDCDTIPYLWMYASRFALYDSFFQGARAPSAPSNVEIIAAQNGETEYKKYGAAGPPYTADPKGAGGRGVPMFVDLDPAWGPYNTKDSSAVEAGRPNLRDRAAQPRRRAIRQAQELHARYRRRHRLPARRGRRGRQLDVVPARLRQSGRSRAHVAGHPSSRAPLLWLHRQQPVDGSRRGRHHPVRLRRRRRQTRR